MSNKGKYKIIDHLGSGGMCEVYRAQHIELERVVALKILSKELAADKRERERFVREARNCATLEHKNIVSIYETGLIDDAPFIAMEYVDGETLEDKLEGKLGQQETIEIVEQIVQALKFAHGNGVIHRDLKPANILITKEGVAKVADWGLSKTTKEEANLTRTGMVMGTPQYMAPEQIMHNEFSAQSDLYSLGVIIFEALAGRLPFPHEDLVQSLQAHIKEKPPKLRRLVESCPRWLDKLVGNLLTKDPKRRISSAAEVLLVLEDKTKPDQTVVTEGIKTSSPSWQKPLAIVALLAIALLVVAPSLFKRNTKSNLGKLKIEKITLPSIDGLEIRYSGTPKKVALSFTTPSKEPLLYQEPKEVDLREGTEINDGKFALKVNLKPYISRNIIVAVGNAPDLYHSHILPGTKRAEARLKPLLWLKGKELTDFLKDLYFLRGKYRRANDEENEGEMKAVKDELSSLFVKCGFSSAFLSKLEKDLPMLIHDQSYLDEPLALLLRPLIMAEAALANKRELRPPWSPIFEHYGVRFLKSPTKSGINSVLPGFHVLGRLGLTRTIRSRLTEEGFLYSRTFLIEPNAGLASQAIFSIAQMNKDKMNVHHGETPPQPGQVKTKLIGLFPIRKLSGFPWPPKRAYLAITSRYLPADIQLAIKLNESDIHYLSNAHGYGREGKVKKSGNTINLLPMAHKHIKKGVNKVEIKLWTPSAGTFAGTVALSEILVLVPRT